MRPPTGNNKNVYKITKLLSGKYRRATDAPIVDKQGRLLTTEAEQGARWVEHFSEVLNKPPPTIEAEVQDRSTRERRNHSTHQLPKKR